MTTVACLLAAALLPAGPIPDWVAVDSLRFEQLVPAGTRYALRIDFARQSLGDTLAPDYGFTAEVADAIAAAPSWLRWDLTDKFRELSGMLRSIYSQLILDCPDPRYRDEVCFQIAHLSKQTLLNISLQAQLLVVNAEYIYRIAPDLHYVELVEHGTPTAGGDYWTTVRYRVRRGGSDVLVELPRDIYYWWIVAPRCSDEVPTMDASVYNRFWRDYLYNYADSGYPLLKNVLAPVRYLWDEAKHVWPNAGLGFGDSLAAVQAVGRWVAHTLPRAATEPRPIQPNQLLRDHDGNCGETQDLLCAGMRTALIPNVSVMDINEDHVWNEIWWNGSFIENQVDLGGGVTHIADSGSAYDVDFGGSKECSCIWDWRADGYQFSAIAGYSKTCTLTVAIVDPRGRPVDGVNVRIGSEDFYPPYGVIAVFAAATGRDGVYSTVLGDSQNYWVSVQGGFGSVALGKVLTEATSHAGNHVVVVDTLTAVTMPELAVTPRTGPPDPDSTLRLVVNYSLPYEVRYGREYTIGSSGHGYAFRHEPGALDFFIVDRPGLDAYLGSASFTAYAVARNTDAGVGELVLPTREDYYAVFANDAAASVSEFVQGTATLYRQGPGAIAEPPAPARPGLTVVRAGPTPAHGRITVRYRLSGAGRVTFEVADLTGRVVHAAERDCLRAGEYTATWSARGQPAGIYFLRLRLGPDAAPPVKFVLVH